MDTSKLVRNPKSVLATLHEMEDDTLVTSTGCKVYVPSRFAERGLASLGAETYIIGICAIVVGDQYGIMMVNAMMRLDPAEINRVQVGEDEYLEFVFYPGSVVIANLKLVKTDTLTYKIYDEIIAKARVPWYLNYFDLAKIFDTARLHAGANIGGNKEVTELLISISARNPKNRVQYYRQVIESENDIATNPPYYASLKDVTLSATNAVNKLGGGYFRNGTVSAINSPSERTERLEEILFS
jgi:hypothetical protein